MKLTELSQDIDQAIERLDKQSERKHSIDQCQTNITRVSDEVRDASSYIPAHDRRVYSEAIKGTQQKLKDAWWYMSHALLRKQVLARFRACAP